MSLPVRNALVHQFDHVDDLLFVQGLAGIDDVDQLPDHFRRLDAIFAADEQRFSALCQTHTELLPDHVRIAVHHPEQFAAVYIFQGYSQGVFQMWIPLLYK